MERTPTDLLNRMLVKATPHSFILHDRETLAYFNDVLGEGDVVPWHANNWQIGQEQHPRVLGALESIKVIDCLQDSCDYTLVFETPAELLRFKTVAEQLDQYSRRLPDTTLGNWVLAAICGGEYPNTRSFLRGLMQTSHSTFGCHALEMAYVDQAGVPVLADGNPDLIWCDAWGEQMWVNTLSIPLLRKDGSQWHALRLVAVHAQDDTEDEPSEVRFRLMGQMFHSAPWTTIATTTQGEFTVQKMIQKLCHRSTVQKDPYKPFR